MILFATEEHFNFDLMISAPFHPLLEVFINYLTDHCKDNNNEIKGRTSTYDFPGVCPPGDGPNILKESFFSLCGIKPNNGD
jgi:hypothetical protein